LNQSANTTVTVLAVSASPEDQASLRAIFNHSRWRLFQVESCAEAIPILAAHSIPVVVGDATLPDGTFHNLLAHGASLPIPPLLIVASHLADDRLWAEALNLGAHDVLAKPFRANEVFRSISLAWRQWNESLEKRSAARREPRIRAALAN